MLLDVWLIRALVDLLGPAGATANARAALDAQHLALAEVDSAVDRLHRRAPAVRPAA